MKKLLKIFWNFLKELSDDFEREHKYTIKNNEDEIFVQVVKKSQHK